MPLAPKRRRLSNADDNAAQEISDGKAGESSASENEHSDGDMDASSEGESTNTEDEIQALRHTKSKKTMKRKRRATSPTGFGATLQSLLNTNAPTDQPLSLKPSVAKKHTDEKLEVKAKKFLEGIKKDKEEKNHIADVIGGWGGDSERALRKVAQRGVVKLFNAIQQTQIAGAAVQEEAKATRGSGKPTLPAPATVDSKLKKKKGRKALPSESVVSESTKSQDAFLSMIKAGGLVSKV